jgi:hypothetical protein
MIGNNNELQNKTAEAPSKSSTVKKSSAWLSGLFQKQSKPTTSKKSIFTFFSSKANKQLLPPKKSSPPAPKSLPIRYPMPIERVIYQIAFIKLRDLKRPLQHQVVVSNMIHWYTSMIIKEATACKKHQLYLQKSLSM